MKTPEMTWEQWNAINAVYAYARTQMKEHLGNLARDKRTRPLVKGWGLYIKSMPKVKKILKDAKIDW